MKNFVSKMIAGSALLCVNGMMSPYSLAQDTTGERVKELENRLQIIQNELEKVKSQSSKVTQKVDSIEQKVTEVEADKKDSIEGHMLFFRGGFAHSAQHRNGTSIISSVVPAGAQDQADKNAWYFGAGFDWNLTRDVWGLVPKTNIFAELMIEYKEFGSHVKGNALANGPTQLVGGVLDPRDVTVSQLTISAAPKVKFMEGSRLRPWIIPIGFGVHVISPPSESITFFNPGIMFGTGVDYKIWKDFYIGVDARYHVTGGKKDGVNVDGLTAGGYVGIGF